jgi:hypothetical protein
MNLYNVIAYQTTETPYTAKSHELDATLQQLAGYCREKKLGTLFTETEKALNANVFCA